MFLIKKKGVKDRLKMWGGIDDDKKTEVEEDEEDNE